MEQMASKIFKRTMAPTPLLLSEANTEVEDEDQ